MDSTLSQLRETLNLRRYLYQNPGTQLGGESRTLGQKLADYDQASRALRQYEQTGQES